MEKWFEDTIKKVAKHNEYGKARTVEECTKLGMWTPCDLILREYLNNGGGSAKGFLGISTAQCIKSYNYAKTIKQELIDKNLINQNAQNNFGFTLWTDYNF